MAGIRLHHPVFASVTYVVELPMDYPVPYECPSCGKSHTRKAIHLRLDSEGDVIVSTDVYASLQTVALAGMELVNEVESPPPLFVGAVDQPKYETLEANLNGHGSHFWTPGMNKYQSGERLLKHLKKEEDTDG